MSDRPIGGGGNNYGDAPCLECGAYSEHDPTCSMGEMNPEPTIGPDGWTREEWINRIAALPPTLPPLKAMRALLDAAFECAQYRERIATLEKEREAEIKLYSEMYAQQNEREKERAETAERERDRCIEVAAEAIGSEYRNVGMVEALGTWSKQLRDDLAGTRAALETAEGLLKESSKGATYRATTDFWDRVEAWLKGRGRIA